MVEEVRGQLVKGSLAKMGVCHRGGEQMVLLRGVVSGEKETERGEWRLDVRRVAG